jgi:signal transduction histidine kinase
LVRADAGLLEQVLSILLTNAINYTPEGGKVVVQTVYAADDGTPRAGLAVCDDGYGIPLEEQPRLFERFFRGQIARETGAPGTGLGLAIAKEIVERHGGELCMQSTGVPGEGAVFTMWLPVGDCDQYTLSS